MNVVAHRRSIRSLFATMQLILIIGAEVTVGAGRWALRSHPDEGLDILLRATGGSTWRVSPGACQANSSTKVLSGVAASKRLVRSFASATCGASPPCSVKR